MSTTKGRAVINNPSRGGTQSPATPAPKTTAPDAGRGQLVRHSSFYPGVKKVEENKKKSLTLAGNRMNTGTNINKTSKKKVGKNRDSDGGVFPTQLPKTTPKKVSADLKERQAKFDALIEGQLTDLPPLPKSAVRVFLSSTFSDMRAERNTLARMVYPVLKDYCASVDLDFQVVDMRWGVTEDSQNDHSVEDLCLQEIKNCQALSLGPNFVCILGDRYGFQLIPNKIVSSEFELILSETTTQFDKDFLCQWYWKDENSDPFQHILQPVRSFYPNFGIYKPGNEEAREIDSTSWYRALHRIRVILRDGSGKLHSKGQISDERLQQYHWSVTECEINTGILSAQDFQNRALFFHRELHGLTDCSADDDAWKYIDVDKDTQQVDSDARSKLIKLSTKTLPGRLGKDACYHYCIGWQKGGLDEINNSDHSKYIYDFCKTFIVKITKLIEQAQTERQSFIQQSEYYSVPEEIIHHLQFCVEKCKTFCGRKETLKQVKKYVLDTSTRKPLVIHAQSGAGKTSLMACIMKSLSQWFGQPYIGAIRFLGTSPQSINLSDVLFSVCGQLADATDLIMEPVGYSNFASLVQYMPRLLRRVASAAKKPIVILLDSIDQLSSANSAYLMKWLPLSLPPNVKLILSVLPTESNILSNIKRRLPATECYLEVPKLPDETVQEIVNTYLSSRHRTLSKDQALHVTQKFLQDPSPLYLKLLLDKAATWHSYTTLSDMRLGENAQDAIHLLFEGLEQKYGRTLVQAALGYITVSLNGLSEIELEDVLSCDDEVLTDVYQYHDPPIEGIVRIPPLLWARIYKDLKEYLVERISHGKTTLYWYHRQFTEVAKERFLTGEQEKHFHKRLLEIYLAESDIQRDVTLHNRKKTIKNADRQVTPQPMVIKNKRKLECISYHLLNSKDAISTAEAKQKVLCNYDFLATKICAFSVQHLIDEIDLFLAYRPDEEIQAIRNFLESSFADLRYPMQLAVHLIAGVPNTKNWRFLEGLLNQARERIISHPNPLLVPNGPCMLPRDLSKNALQTCQIGCKQILSSSNNHLITKEEGIEESTSVLGVLNIQNGEHKIFEQFKYETFVIDPVLVQNELYLVTDKTLTIFNVNTGDAQETEANFGLKVGDSIKSITVSKLDEVLGILTSRDTFIAWDIKQMSTMCTVAPFNWNKLSNICPHSSNPYLVVAGEVSPPGNSSTGVISLIYVNGSDETKANASIFTPSPIAKGKMEIVLGTQYLVACSDSSTKPTVLYVFSLLPFELVHTIGCPMEISTINSYITSFGPLAAMTFDQNSMVAYNLETGKLEIKIDLEDDNVTYMLPSLVTIHQASHFVLGGKSGSISFVDVQNGKQAGQLKAFESSVSGILLVNDKLVAYAQSTQLKVWDFVKLCKAGIQPVNNDISKDNIYEDTTITNIEFSTCGQSIYCCSKNSIVKVWSVHTGELKATYTCGLDVSDIKAAKREVVVFHSKSEEKVKVLCGNTGEEYLTDMPSNVLSTLLSRAKTFLYIVTHVEGRLKLYEYELSRARLSRSFLLQKGLNFSSVSALLSYTERYLVLVVECTEEDRKSIAVQWKRGGFAPQPHPYRFSAIDLTHTSGTLLHCYRQLSKIPALGSAMIAHMGNTMIFCVRRCVCFWDIPTGRCDQMITKYGRHGMFYNPTWLGGGDNDIPAYASCIVESEDRSLVVMGSGDGYCTTYDADGGAPVGRKAPLTKHNAPVIWVGISADSKWIFSACQKNVLKMWHAETGWELFSLRLDGRVRSAKLSSDSRHLVLITGASVTRTLVFQIFPGKPEDKTTTDINRLKQF